MPGDLLQALNSGRVLLMDGAMGTELQRAGMPEGACYEQWNVTKPERVLAIHRAYVEAGAQVLLTNTFQANPPALSKHGLQKQLNELCQAGANLARTAIGAQRFVLGDITPFDRLQRDRMIEFLAGWKDVDGLMIETCTDLSATWLFRTEMVLAAADHQGHPARHLLSFAFHRASDGKLRTIGRSVTPEEVAHRVAPSSALALGVNCGRDITMDDCIEITHRYRDITNMPLFARPNAGTPMRVDGQWIYPHTPEQMAAKLPGLLEAGVSMVGGCCGTTPAHIAAFRRVVDSWNARR